MKQLNWMGKAAMATLLIAFAIAVGAPTHAGAVANPQKTVWTIGNKDVKILKDGTLVTRAPIEYTEEAITGITATTTIGSTAAFVSVAAGSAITLTSDPSISTTTAEGFALATGKKICIVGTSDSNTIEIEDDDTNAGSQVELGATSRVLGLNDLLCLRWKADASTTGRWLEESFSNLN